MTQQTQIALVGIGEIARNQHIPSIAKTDGLSLAAGVSRNATIDGLENYTKFEDLLAERDDVDAIALCTPPQIRFSLAWKALNASKHVLLEKPPGTSVAEVEALRLLAAEKGVTLFATWHSRFAPAVEPAKAWLQDKTIQSLKINWREDVRKWHPGQKWIWQAGGMGVFDPGINALSIATHIMPTPFHVTAATLEFPSNCETPIAASLTMTDHNATSMDVVFDWRQEGPQTWDIEIETKEGHLKLSEGGSKLWIDGALKYETLEAEYPGIYARFAELIKTKQNDVDITPLTHVADAFMLGKRVETEAFYD